MESGKWRVGNGEWEMESGKWNGGKGRMVGGVGGGGVTCTYSICTHI